MKLKYGCDCGYTGALEAIGQGEYLCPQCGNIIDIDDCYDEYGDPGERYLRQMEDMAAYMFANGNLEAYYEDQAAGYCH